MEEREPLRPRDYLILIALSTEPLHGYGVITGVEHGTDGSTRLDPANLYRSIRRLVRDGLVEETEVPEGEEAPGSDRRRFWSLTPRGQEALRAEAARLARLTELARGMGLLPAPFDG